MSDLLNDHDTCYEDFELWFITFKVKMGSKGLGNEVSLKRWNLYILKPMTHVVSE